MFNTFQPVPVDVALNDMRHIPADEHSALIDIHNQNLEGCDQDFDDIDDEFEELEVVGEEDFFIHFCDEVHLFD